MIIIMLVFVWLHLLHNRLLKNIRLFLKKTDAFWCCCWNNVINWLMCHLTSDGAESHNGCIICIKSFEGLIFCCEDKCVSQNNGWIMVASKHIVLGIYHFILAIDLEKFANSIRKEESDWLKSD